MQSVYPHRGRMRAAKADAGSTRSVRRTGIAAVEFAIVAPVFFLLVFGLLEISRMAMVQHAMTNAAREGCRVAVLASTINTSSVDNAVRNHLEASIGQMAWNGDKARVTTPEDLTNTQSQTDIVVSIEIDYADVSWLPLSPFGVDTTLSAVARRKRE